jgi:hypothetical protein
MKEVMEFERQELAMETLGMSLAEGKAVLTGVQEFVAEQQAVEFLERERTCRHCGRHLSSKGAGSTSVRTVFGTDGCRTHAGISVESTVNQVISKRMVKKQQMQWTPRGAHLLLQTRTKVLNNELEAVFRRWYPRFRSAA